MIGLDVGYNQIRAAIWRGGTPSLIRDGRGRSALPLHTGGALPLRGLRAMLGRQFGDEALVGLRLPIEAGPRGQAWLRIGDTLQPPSHLLAPAFTRIRELASAPVGTPLVLSVPNSSGPPARAAFAEAAHLAGFSLKSLLSKSVARALQAGHVQGRIASVNVGDGVDVVILSVEPGRIEVLGSSVDEFGGGHALDTQLVNWMVKTLVRRRGRRPDTQALTRLRAAAENARHQLDNIEQIRIDLPFLTSERGGPLHLDTRLTRAELAALIQAPTDRIRAHCLEALKRSEVDISTLEQVLFGGGLSHSPMLQRHIEAAFERPLYNSDPNDTARGAARFAGAIGESREFAVIERASYQVEVAFNGQGRRSLIERGAALPAALDLDASAQTVQIFVDDQLVGEVDAKSKAPIRMELDRSGMLQARAGDARLKILWGDIASRSTSPTAAARTDGPGPSLESAAASVNPTRLQEDLARLDEIIRRLERGETEPAQLRDVRELSAALRGHLKVPVADPADSAGSARLRERLRSAEQELLELRAWKRNHKEEHGLLRTRFTVALEDARQSANEQLVRSLLPVLDLLEGSNDPSIRRALRLLQGALRTAGLRRIRCRVGDIFDSKLHKAKSVAYDPQLPDCALIDTLRHGYTLGGRPIRRAQVVLNHLESRPDDPI